MGTILGRPWPSEMTADDLRIDIEKGLADIARERKVRFGIVFQIIIEDAADAAMLVSVRQDRNNRPPTS